MQEVVAAYKDPGTNGVKQVQSTGLHIAGERFIVIKAEDRSIYGKKVSGTCERAERRGGNKEKEGKAQAQEKMGVNMLRSRKRHGLKLRTRTRMLTIFNHNRAEKAS